MKTVSMLQFRRQAERILKQLSKGEGFLLTYRGKPVARVEPVAGEPAIPDDDPIYRLGELSKLTSRSSESLTNEQIDQILYGQ